jgi:hypothetical protein
LALSNLLLSGLVPLRLPPGALSPVATVTVALPVLLVVAAHPLLAAVVAVTTPQGRTTAVTAMETGTGTAVGTATAPVALIRGMSNCQVS